MRALRVLISAYACEPGTGSEAAVGWNLAERLSQRHEVVVMTRANNQAVIERAQASGRGTRLRFAYHDLPAWAAWWKRGARGVQAYYYLWQLSGRARAAQVIRTFEPDLVHHLTFGKYWSPSALAHQGLPFVWGPLGGGERTPRRFLTTLGIKGRAYETARHAAKAAAERELTVRATARSATIAVASTPETARRLAAVGARRVEPLLQMGVDVDELPFPVDADDDPPGVARFVTLGRLLAWKGVHLAIKAFVAADLPASTLTVVGDGPEIGRLRRLASASGVGHRISFVGSLPRPAALEVLASSHALIHPSLHDQAPSAIFEAMAIGRPVICLEVGGPAVQVSPEVGFMIPAVHPDRAIREMAEAMRRIANEPCLRREMGLRARERVANEFTWEAKATAMAQLYEDAIASYQALRARPGPVRA